MHPLSFFRHLISRCTATVVIQTGSSTNGGDVYTDGTTVTETNNVPDELPQFIERGTDLPVVFVIGLFIWGHFESIISAPLQSTDPTKV
jgi:hypothetical protein